MWIRSSRNSGLRPFGIKRRGEQIKALGVYYTYDMKLVHEKNSIERRINLWFSRGLSI